MARETEKKQSVTIDRVVILITIVLNVFVLNLREKVSLELYQSVVFCHIHVKWAK